MGYGKLLFVIHGDTQPRAGRVPA